MGSMKKKKPIKRQRPSEKEVVKPAASAPVTGKRRKKGKGGNVARSAEQNDPRAENEITKLLQEARDAVKRSAETGDDMDSDLEMLKEAVEEAEAADMEDSSASDSDSSSGSESDAPPAKKKASAKKGGKHSKDEELSDDSNDSGSDDGSDLVPLVEVIPAKKDDPSAESSANDSDDGEDAEELREAEDSGSADESDASGSDAHVPLVSLKSKKPDSAGSEAGESDSDSGEEGAQDHNADLEDLKMADPDFYKFLQENDKDLLNFEAGSGSEGDGEENDDDGSDADDESDDAEEEAAAAAEAGLDVSKPKKTKPAERKSRVVDLGYLRELQTQLSNRRTSLKACRDLLRIFRAGRELAVSSKVVKTSKKNALKAKKRQRKNKQSADGDVVMGDEEEEDSDDEEFVDDGSLVAGEIRFASSKAYQKAMNMAIIGIQGTIDMLLAKPDVDKAGTDALAAWDPREHKRWEHLEPTFKVFVYHMFALIAHMKDACTLRFLLKRAKYLVPYTKGQPSLTRKLTRVALSYWSAPSRDVSHTTKLCSYLLLHSVACEDENTEIVLRKVTQSFTKSIATVCNPRTLPSIVFSVKCIVELFGIDMGASYTVTFTHLRQLAILLRTVLTSKDMNNDIEKIYNWTIINSIRLWSAVLAQYGSKDELHALIYPFVQVSLGILRLQSSPRNYPLRLHVCSFVTDLAIATGVYIPVPPHLLAILRCAELKKVPQPGATRAIEWRSILRVGDEVVATKPYLGGIIQGVVMQLAKYFAGISKHVSFPEISHAVVAELRKFSKLLRVPDWRRDIGDLCDQLKKTAQIVSDMRAKADFGPKGAIGPKGMLQIVPGIPAESKTPIQRMYAIERKRQEKQELVRDETNARDEKEKERKKANVGTDDADDAGDDDESDEEVEPQEKVSKKKKGNQKKKTAKQKETVSMALVVSDEEPDEVADFQLSDSE